MAIPLLQPSEEFATSQSDRAYFAIRAMIVRAEMEHAEHHTADTFGAFGNSNLAFDAERLGFRTDVGRREPRDQSHQGCNGRAGVALRHAPPTDCGEDRTIGESVGGGIEERAPRSLGSGDASHRPVDRVGARKGQHEDCSEQEAPMCDAGDRNRDRPNCAEHGHSRRRQPHREQCLRDGVQHVCRD